MFFCTGVVVFQKILKKQQQVSVTDGIVKIEYHLVPCTASTRIVPYFLRVKFIICRRAKCLIVRLIILFF